MMSYIIALKNGDTPTMHRVDTVLFYFGYDNGRYYRDWDLAQAAGYPQLFSSIGEAKQAAYNMDGKHGWNTNGGYDMITDDEFEIFKVLNS